MSNRFLDADPAYFVHRAAELWDDHLGERLSGVYFIGSLAHGGYSERFSDIDVALISKDLLSADDLDAIHRSAALAQLSQLACQNDNFRKF
jgi:predicted nucleotidyltransferase